MWNSFSQIHHIVKYETWTENLWDMTIYSAIKGQITPLTESFRQQLATTQTLFFMEVQLLLKQKNHT